MNSEQTLLEQRAREDWERRIHRRLTDTADADATLALPAPTGVRAESAAGLLKKWQAQNTRRDATASTYPDPQSALQAAIDAADPTDRIVVFGSFYTVGGILKDGVPRLIAQHMPNI